MKCKENEQESLIKKIENMNDYKSRWSKYLGQ